MKTNDTLILLLLLISCSDKQSNDFETQITVDYKNLSEVRLSEYVEDVSVVKLETSGDCIIGNIAKIQLYEDRIYILDDLSNAVYIFDKNGAFTGCLNRRGAGPGEYVLLKDMCVSEKGILVLDFSTQSLLLYDFNFNLKEKTGYSSYSSNVIVTDTTFWTYNEPSPWTEDYQLEHIDKNGRIIKGYFPRGEYNGETMMNWMSSNVFQVNNDEFYFSPRYGNIIYKKKDDQWDGNINISFGNKTFPANRFIGDYNIYSDEFDYIIRDKFYISDKLVVLDFFLKNIRHFSFTDRETKITKSGKTVNDIIAGLERFAPMYFDDNYLIDSIEAEYVIESFPVVMEYDKSLSGLSVTDNPVLLFYKLKS
ncbi:MAG: 6-bladed beta-propeller [Tannerella sp.]|jgi:hypothetical protein|nr:6-bladed beta-propeller [Tannerella sp.]